MLILQAVTLCLALCIFSGQPEYSYGESIGSKDTLHSITLNEKWQDYGCKNNPKLEKPFGKLELCLGTILNQLILRILQNYSPTPLPEYFIIEDGKKGFENQVRKYIEAYLPEVYADKKKLEHIFDQVNEYLFKPLIKYMDQFPMDAPEPEEQALIDSRRKEIANILKKYVKEPMNPVVPVTGSSFQENLPALVRYLTRYAPNLTQNLDVLTPLLYRIKRYGFKEFETRDLSKLPKNQYDKIVSKVSNVINQYKKPADRHDVVLPHFVHDFQSFKPWLVQHFKTQLPNLFANKPMFKNVLKEIEELFDGITPRNSTPDNINGLDKNILLQFVEKYYPEQFGNPVFRDELVQTYEAQPRSNVLPTSEPGNNQLGNALLNFFKKVYPKLSVDKQFVQQFSQNFKPVPRNRVKLSVDVPEFETISPTRAEILEYVNNQVMKGTTGPNETYIVSNGKAGQINMNVPATSPVPQQVELVPTPSRRVLTQDLSDEAQTSEIDPEIIVSPATVEFAQDPTVSEQMIIRQKILECIKESFPHIYANKPVLREILRQLESNILSGTDIPPVSLETQIRRFTKAYVPKITEEQSDTEGNFPDDEVINTQISPENKEQLRTIKKFYIVKGTVSNSKPAVSVVNPEEQLIEIDVTPEEMKQSGSPVENVYIVDDNGSAGKVSFSNRKPNAIVNVQPTGNNIRNPNKQKFIKLQHNIKFEPNNALGKISKEDADKRRKEYMMILKKFHENVLQDKEYHKQLNIEMPKVKHVKVVGKYEPTAGIYNKRFTEYGTDSESEKLAIIQFPYEHNFLPLMMRSYGPLYEKEQKGESLTNEERLKMHVLETLFAKNQAFRELYLKKFGTQDKFDIKSMLYNMYKMDLKENDGKLIQIDPIKNVKFRRVDKAEIEMLPNENHIVTG